MNTVAKPITPLRPSSLMEAFTLAQRCIEPNPAFDMKANTGKFSYPYLSLGRVLEIIRPALSANGISLQQFVEEKEGKLFVVTRLIHECGQMQDFLMPLFGITQNPQDFGKAFTYARRYALYGLFGIYGEEDDDTGSLQKVSVESQKRALLPKLIALIGKDEERRKAILKYYNVEELFKMTLEQMQHCIQSIEKKSQEKKDENPTT